MGNRHKLQILAAILVAAKGGAKKTNIMYRANLSYNQVRRDLPLLMTAGLLKKNSVGYETTEKGLEYLRAWRTLTTIMRTD